MLSKVADAEDPNTGRHCPRTGLALALTILLVGAGTIMSQGIASAVTFFPDKGFHLPGAHITDWVGDIRSTLQTFMLIQSGADDVNRRSLHRNNSRRFRPRQAGTVRTGSPFVSNTAVDVVAEDQRPPVRGRLFVAAQRAPPDTSSLNRLARVTRLIKQASGPDPIFRALLAATKQRGNQRIASLPGATLAIAEVSKFKRLNSKPGRDTPGAAQVAGLAIAAASGAQETAPTGTEPAATKIDDTTSRSNNLKITAPRWRCGGEAGS